MNVQQNNSDSLNEKYQQKLNVLKNSIQEKNEPNRNITEEQLENKREKANDLYKKKVNTLRHYLKGKGFHSALKALKFGEEEHSKIGTGYRKDKVTPNFYHQVEIALSLITLKEVVHEEETIIAGLLHDVMEDCNVEKTVIEQKFGKLSADAIEKLTKEFKGIKKDMQSYFDVIATCPIASLVKLADRMNNISTMVGVFTIPKQEEYVKEIKDYFIPLLKEARGNFPEQSMSYHNMSLFLKQMCKTIEAVLVAEKINIQIKDVLEVLEQIENNQLQIKPKSKKMKLG